jgi:hypothetical protein
MASSRFLISDVDIVDATPIRGRTMVSRTRIVVAISERHAPNTPR